MDTFIDAHAHLSSLSDQEISSYTNNAHKVHVNTIINVCSEVSSLQKAQTIPQKGIYHTGATSPHDVAKKGEQEWPLFSQAAQQGFFKAIGETGLDYHYSFSPRDIQKEFFLRYLALATSCNLPVVIHCREAFSDLFSLLDTSFSGPVMIHCFTGTIEEAKKALDRGYYISCSGIVTFKNSKELREVMQYVPLDRLLIETDTPYLAPIPYRGKKNEPAYVIEVAKAIATIKKISLSEVAQTTSNNARSFFRL